MQPGDHTPNYTSLTDVTLGVVPIEAEAILQQRAARARWEEANRRLQARMNARSAPRTEFERLAPWYQQGSMA